MKADSLHCSLTVMFRGTPCKFNPYIRSNFNWSNCKKQTNCCHCHFYPSWRLQLSFNILNRKKLGIYFFQSPLNYYVLKSETMLQLPSNTLATLRPPKKLAGPFFKILTNKAIVKAYIYVYIKLIICKKLCII